jgi:hypothetical protein
LASYEANPAWVGLDAPWPGPREEIRIDEPIAAARAGGAPLCHATRARVATGKGGEVLPLRTPRVGRWRRERAACGRAAGAYPFMVSLGRASRTGAPKRELLRRESPRRERRTGKREVQLMVQLISMRFTL